MPPSGLGPTAMLAFLQTPWLSHRTLRYLHNSFVINDLREQGIVRALFRSEFRSELNHTLQDYLSRLGTVGGSVFIPRTVFPRLSFLFWNWFRIVLVCSLYGAVAGAIFPHHHRAGGVRWPGLNGRHGGRGGEVGADRDHDRLAAVAGHHHDDQSGDAQGRRADADARLGRR